MKFKIILNYWKWNGSLIIWIVGLLYDYSYSYWIELYIRLYGFPTKQKNHQWITREKLSEFNPRIKIIVKNERSLIRFRYSNQQYNWKIIQKSPSPLKKSKFPIPRNPFYPVPSQHKQHTVSKIIIISFFLYPKQKQTYKRNTSLNKD